jgi:hypothetical protein
MNLLTKKTPLKQLWIVFAWGGLALAQTAPNTKDLITRLSEVFSVSSGIETARIAAIPGQRTGQGWTK